MYLIAEILKPLPMTPSTSQERAQPYLSVDDKDTSPPPGRHLASTESTFYIICKIFNN